ncbi:ABC-2 transporter permease [Clostridium novyi]|uniref:Membrane spanning protein, putative n=1 Tax=Clostridium novyi (strain NT) TaxID=386415 RepID=A0Q294_CLONN|nr:ABC transporter permease subunit [Clostridium novyi]ABK62220.1 membrane spanning protein, putative [Clostridium novyi NT]KEH86295.1 membrane protein [Clostridium novyi A str. NCTC 538]
MKNYFNKALFYKEWRNIRAIAIIFYLQVLSMIIMPFINTIDSIKECRNYGDMSQSQIFAMNKQSLFRHLENRDTFVLMAILIIAIATCVVGYDLIGRKYDILSSMPFKKKEIIFTKWLSIFITMIVPLAIGYFIIYAVYLMNINLLGSYVTSRMILTWICMNLLVSIFILTFIMLIQCLSGICGLGGIVGAIFLILPIGLSMLVNEIISLYGFSKDSTYFQGIQDKIVDICSSLTPSSYCFRIVYEIPDHNESYNYYTNMYYSNRYCIPNKFKILILIIATIITFALMIYAFNRFKLEKIGNIIAFKPLEPIFKIGVSVCFGLLGAAFTSSITSSHYDLWKLREINAPELVTLSNKAFTITILMGILCGCLVYVITNKILEANKK